MAVKKIVTSKRGRKCSAPGCKRLLSIYNHNVHCHAHLNEAARRDQIPANSEK